jgi:putative DNA primase/helicase
MTNNSEANHAQPNQPNSHVSPTSLKPTPPNQTHHGSTALPLEVLLGSGYALVPIPHAKKGPNHQGWNRRENTITQPNELTRINGNVGLAHAYSTPTPTCAIDVDYFPDAKKWFNALKVDLTALLAADDAVAIWSGKMNSIKLLYRLPLEAGVLPSQTVRNARDRTILEFRCGTTDGLTVQDLLPPSIHPSGSQYQFAGPGDPTNLPMLPKQLMRIWRRLIRGKTILPPQTTTPPRRQGTPREAPRQVATVRYALFKINADCCYEQWRNVIWALLSTGWTCAVHLAKRWSETAPHRFDEEAFWSVVNSYDLNRDAKITLGTLYHYVREGEMK